MTAFPAGRNMDLLLWRHAEAEEGDEDLRRRLTERGEKQARQMAAWIRGHQPKDLRIVVSPAVRTQQTAEALKLPFETNRKIGPEACVSELIAAAGWPAGQEADWSIKKGALWWLSNRTRRGENQTVLRAMIPVELLD